MTTVAPPPVPERTSIRQEAGPGVGLAIGVLAIGAAAMIGVLGVIAGLVFLAGGADGDGSGTAVAAPVESTLEIELTEFTIAGELTAPAGIITLDVTNAGTMAHNLVLRDLGARTSDLQPGRSELLELGNLAPGEYSVLCDIPGHEGAGMVATLTVTGDGTGTAAAASAGDGHAHSHGDEPDWAAMDEAMMESMLAFPAETEGRGNPILEPVEILADGTKVFELTAEIVEWELEPGNFVEAWTYNGVVPAPQIILDRGDSIQVKLTNNLPVSTDIHWHGVHTPNSEDGVSPYTQDPIPANGGEYTYEFTVHDDAIGMYHAHNHAQMAVVNGMFGAFVVGENPIPYGQTFSGVTIPEDLELAVDMPMILNDAGTIGLSLNGKSFPATEPLVLQEGDWASVTYYNEGLQIHPMHLHQFPQLVYAKDGIPLDHPYWVDTLNVAPGERYTVLFRAEEAGVWVWHCHILTHVERHDGMFGMVTAIIVEENPNFDPTENPVQPHNWRNTATSPDGPVAADSVAHDHGDATEPTDVVATEPADPAAEHDDHDHDHDHDHDA